MRASDSSVEKIEHSDQREVVQGRVLDPTIVLYRRRPWRLGRGVPGLADPPL